MDLPAPDAVSLERSTRLSALIADEIAAAGGWIPFYRYMEMALYAPGLGYYRAGAKKFGAGGDFVTAPEMTSLFGKVLAVQIRELMSASAPEVIEVGAGSGRLAADVLLELDRLGCAPERYGILELSEDLSARQLATLAERAPRLAQRVYWLDELPGTFSGVVVANELLDAMPLHVIALREEGIFERGVEQTEAGAFAWADRPAHGAVLKAAQRLPASLLADSGEDEYVTEINLAAEAWIADWGARLECGALLLIDYGFPQAEFYLPSRSRGTLMCHYRHRAYDDPFLWPGLSDITGSVDFTAMAEAGYDAGLDVLGYTRQGSFLFDCGIIDWLKQRGPHLGGSVEYAKAIRAMQELATSEMGEVFKVLALGRGIEPPLQGFMTADRTHTL